MIKIDRYITVIIVSVILGITRYYLYDNSDFNLFSLTDRNKKEIKVNLDLIDNEINSYEVSGYVKNLVANIQNIQIKGTSFIYVLNKQKGEINNLYILIKPIIINLMTFII